MNNWTGEQFQGTLGPGKIVTGSSPGGKSVLRKKDLGNIGIGNIFGEDRDWKQYSGISEPGNIRIGEHEDWGVSLGNMGTRNSSGYYLDQETSWDSGK